MSIAFFKEESPCQQLSLLWLQINIAILDHPNYAEAIISKDLLPGGLLIEIEDINEATQDEEINQLRQEIAQLKQLIREELHRDLREMESEIQKLSKREVIATVDGVVVKQIALEENQSTDDIVLEIVTEYLQSLLTKYSI